MRCMLPALLLASAVTAVIAIAPASGRGEEPRPQGGPARGALAERVTAAIARGKTYLVATQRPDGMWVPRPLPGRTGVDPNGYGEQALVLLALAKAGVAASDPTMKRGLEALHAERARAQAADAWGHGSLPFHTYSACTLLLLLDALHVEGPARRRPASQLGGASVDIPPAVARLVRDIARWLQTTQRDGLWRYPWPPPHHGDVSATQFAVMALRSAERLGARVEPAVYRGALRGLLTLQARDGPEVPLWGESPTWDGTGEAGRWTRVGRARSRGWRYAAWSTEATGGMTCAGVASLAIIKDRLKSRETPAGAQLTPDEEKALDTALLDGLAWLGGSFRVDANPGYPEFHYSYLYAMERACVLLGVENLGEHDWYQKGAEHLLRQQLRSGGWTVAKQGQHYDQRDDIQAAFALLFLTRATVPTRFRAPVVTQGDGPPGPDADQR